MTNGLRLLAAAAAALPAGWLAAKFARYEAQTGDSFVLPVIAVSMAIFLWAAETVPSTGLFAATLLLGWTLLVLSVVDTLALRLPDIFTLPLTAAGLLVSLWLPDRDPLGHLIGAAAGFAVLFGIALVFRRVRGREGLGLGDAKLTAAAGAWVGWQALPATLLIACAAGFIQVGVAVAFRGKAALREQIAFGVPLCLAIWLIWLYGPPAFALQ